MNRRGQEGVALISVLVVLASMALLMTGVYSLVSESTRSAGKNVTYQTTRGLAESGMGQIGSLIRRVVLPNFDPAAPPGYGVQWNRQAFGDYLRDQVDRAGAAGAPNPCTQANPDIAYTANTTGGPVPVAACITRVSAGSIPGSGGGEIFARTSRGTADNQSMFEVTVWVDGPDNQVVAQRLATARGFH